MSDKILSWIRALPRPILTLVFPIGVLIIGGTVAGIFAREAVKFIDRDISLMIVSGLMALITSLSTAALMVMSYLFGERAAKKKEDK